MNIMNHPFDVVVIGAGQAGLACGWHLKQQGVDFLILDEQQQPGGNWRNYYDSLELFSPAAYSSLSIIRPPPDGGLSGQGVPEQPSTAAPPVTFSYGCWSSKGIQRYEALSGLRVHPTLGGTEADLAGVGR